VVSRDAPPEAPHDEVGVAVGPDRDGLGLFDAPITGTATGEHTEGGPLGAEPAGGQARTAVLAWIAALAPPTTALTGDGTPCAPLKRLIADEPLDPLPALDGAPPRPRTPARRAAPPADAVLAPEREDTATQIEGFGAMLERRAARDDGTAAHGIDPGEPTDSARVSPPAPTRAPGPRAVLLLALVTAVVAWVLLALR
jgi:hypothetical protein